MCDGDGLDWGKTPRGRDGAAAMGLGDRQRGWGHDVGESRRGRDKEVLGRGRRTYDFYGGKSRVMLNMRLECTDELVFGDAPSRGPMYGRAGQEQYKAV